MKKILVQPVSEQTIPNVLAIKHFRPERVLFISTHEMSRRRKLESIVEACRSGNMEFNYDTVIVREESFADCQEKLRSWVCRYPEVHNNCEFIVNLTCGTKIMAIAIYEFFRNFRSTILYMPIGRNCFLTIYPSENEAVPEELEERLSVVEYIQAYGIKIIDEESERMTYLDEVWKRGEITRFIACKYNVLKNMLGELFYNLRDLRDCASAEVTIRYPLNRQEESRFAEMLKAKVEKGRLSFTCTRSLARYLTGGWLEEYCYLALYPFLGKEIDDLVLAVTLKSSKETVNEFDVLFTRDNALYIIECKSLDQETERQKNALYKIGALHRDYGLRVKSFLLTLSERVLKDGEIREEVKARAEQFDTTIITSVNLINCGRYIMDIINRKNFGTNGRLSG